MSPPWVRDVPDGIELAILVQPRASKSRVVGEHDGQLKIQLAAPPVDGEANAALIELVARLLEVPRRAVSLVSGDASRRKRLRVVGLAAGDAAVKLAPP